MARKALTELLDDQKLRKAVAALVAAEIEGEFKDGGGLYLRVTGAGRARFIHLCPFKGKRLELWLEGVYPKEITLNEARRERAAQRALADAGTDPRKADDGPQVVPRFKDFCEAHREHLAPPQQRKGPIEKTQWWRDVSKHVGPLATLPIDAITVEDMAEHLKRYWKGPKATPTAVRLVDHIRRAMGRRHLLTRPKDLDWSNPFTLENARQFNGSAKHTVKHYASLQWRDAPALMRELAELPDMSARLLEFIIYAGCRLNESRLAKWEQFKMLTIDGAVDRKTGKVTRFTRPFWVIPGEVRKTEVNKDEEDAQDFLVPVTAAMMRTLRQAARHHRCKPTDYVFPTYRKKGNHPYQRRAPLERLQLLRPGITVHGWRTTFTSWGTNRHGGHRTKGRYGRDTMDACLSHVIRFADRDGVLIRLSDAAAAYGWGGGVDPYLEERREVMREWSYYLTSGPVENPDPAGEEPVTDDAANVFPFPARQAA